MGWDFSTEPEFQEQLDWVERFCLEEVEPLEYVFPYAVRSREPKIKGLVKGLQDQIKAQGLWAIFLDEDLGDEDSINPLVAQMFHTPEAAFYFLQRNDSPVNPALQASFARGDIIDATRSGVLEAALDAISAAASVRALIVFMVFLLLVTV